jgi:hypothetical protein
MITNALLFPSLPYLLIIHPSSLAHSKSGIDFLEKTDLGISNPQHASEFLSKTSIARIPCPTLRTSSWLQNGARKKAAHMRQSIRGLFPTQGGGGSKKRSRRVSADQAISRAGCSQGVWSQLPRQCRSSVPSACYRCEEP